jgi:hypothetical protein
MVLSLACLGSMGFAFDLECSRFLEGARFGDYLTCFVDNLTITHRDAVMNPSSYDDNDNFKSLTIRQQIVHYVPKFIEKFAKRLEYLTIYNCGLKEVRKEDLKQFPQLKILWLKYNDLEWLEGDLFVFNPKIEEIFFEGNKKLKYIEANLLDSLPKLVNANFYLAECIDIWAFNPKQMEKLKTKLKTECKDTPTKLKMLVEQTTTTTTTESVIVTTESETVTTLVPSQADESPTESSVQNKAVTESVFVMCLAPAFSLLALDFFLLR